MLYDALFRKRVTSYTFEIELVSSNPFCHTPFIRALFTLKIHCSLVNACINGMSQLLRGVKLKLTNEPH